MSAQSNEASTATTQQPKTKSDGPMLHKDLMKLMAKAGYAKMTRWSQPVSTASK